MADTAATTGLVLAGGRGTRMGGVDKGLQDFHGQPLALHALRRLQPQVDMCMVNANRHLDSYAAFGVPVWPDADAAFAGPLAGMLAGLRHCSTPYLATVPCDAPHFPPDLVAQLHAALAARQADIAMATSPDTSPDTSSTPGSYRPQPVFCLLHTRLQHSLAAFLAAGGRKVGQWAAQHRCVQVPFADAAAFTNVNTQEALAAVARLP